ncbi:MAG: ATP-binding protein [Nitrospirota bacterium]
MKNKSPDKTKRELAKELAEAKKKLADYEASAAKHRLGNKGQAESQSFLSRIFDSILDPFCIIDRDYNIARTNKEYAQRKQKNVNSLIGKKCYETLYKRDAVCDNCIVEKTFKSSDPCVKEKQLHLADGTEAWEEIYTYPIINKKGFVTHVIQYTRDVTERKLAEMRQQQLLSDIENVNRELKDFAYIVSHDLKAPLRSIGSLANWITADYADKFDEDGKEQMGLIALRVKRMHALIDGILQYSRIGRIHEEKVEIDLNELLKEVIDILSPPEHIQVSVEGKLPVILSERTRIRQIFQNLISNAIKYMDKHQGKIKVGCSDANGFWKFSVSDNGPGIEERYFEKIFQLFQTLKPIDESESTGVGLTIVKKIIDMHGGKIWLESKPGFGTTFFFTLPKHQNSKIKQEDLSN